MVEGASKGNEPAPPVSGPPERGDEPLIILEKGDPA